MNQISGKNTLDKLDEKYSAFIKENENKPMTREVMQLISLVEGYMVEACYYHDKFVECLYS